MTSLANPRAPLTLSSGQKACCRILIWSIAGGRLFRATMATYHPLDFGHVTEHHECVTGCSVGSCASIAACCRSTCQLPGNAVPHLNTQNRALRLAMSSLDSRFARLSTGRIVVFVLNPAYSQPKRIDRKSQRAWCIPTTCMMKTSTRI